MRTEAKEDVVEMTMIDVLQCCELSPAERGKNRTMYYLLL
jgi:hypothetical protein